MLEAPASWTPLWSGSFPSGKWLQLASSAHRLPGWARWAGRTASSSQPYRMGFTLGSEQNPKIQQSLPIVEARRWHTTQAWAFITCKTSDRNRYLAGGSYLGVEHSPRHLARNRGAVQLRRRSLASRRPGLGERPVPDARAPWRLGGSGRTAGFGSRGCVRVPTSPSRRCKIWRLVGPAPGKARAGKWDCCIKITPLEDILRRGVS